MPFGPYKDFADCVAQNQDVDDPEGYCAWLQNELKDEADVVSSDDMKLQIVPVTSFADENNDGIDDVTGEPVEEIIEEVIEDVPSDTDAIGEDFHSLLVVEGVWTGDGRYIDEEALSWRNLPLPLMGLDKTTDAHMEARLIGNITRIEREGREIHGYGTFVKSDSDEVQRLQQLIRDGDLRGVSVDLDAMEYEVIIPQDVQPTENEDGQSSMPVEDFKMRVTAARIMGACYDDETEILTETLGWVRFEDLPQGERVATMNPKTMEFEWQEPTAYTNDPWDGKMIRFTSGGQQNDPSDPAKMHRSLDLLVTPNHRMLVESVSTGKRSFMRADELITKSHRSYKIPATSEWTAPDVWAVKIEPVREMATQARKMEFDADTFAQFMGAYLSEGSLGVNGVVSISQQETSKGFALFSDVMGRMFPNHRHDGRVFVTKHQALHDWLRQFGTALEKFVPEEIKNMSARQIKLFLDAYIAGDGDTEGRRIYTSSKRMADDLQELAQKAGMWAHITQREMGGSEIDGRFIKANGPGYIVNLRNREGSRPAAYCWDWSAEWLEHHEGMVRCVTVPNESLYVRRNGIPIWCGNTVVPFPAFEEAYIESLAALTAALTLDCQATGYISKFQSFDDIDFTAPDGARQEAEKGLAWRDEYNRGGTAVGVARARDIANGKNLSPDTINRMVSYFARHEIDKQGEGWSPDEDGFPSAGRIAWALWGGDPGRVWAEKVQGQMRSREESGSVVASGFPVEAPVCPPAAWFNDPGLSGPTPMTISNDGRIYGHVATWGTCHIGFTDQCVTPPKSLAAYQHYLTGEILTEEGTRVPVGQITMDTGHAPLNANGARALAHYDNTGTAVADVRTGEDAYGIWMAGALRPGLDPVKVRGLMASDVSGDWRRIGGNLELVGVLAVNVPGFPKARIQVHENEGLIASLIASIPEQKQDRKQPDMSRAADRIAASIGRDKRTRASELRNKIHRGEN